MRRPCCLCSAMDTGFRFGDILNLCLWELFLAFWPHCICNCSKSHFQQMLMTMVLNNSKRHLQQMLMIPVLNMAKKSWQFQDAQWHPDNMNCKWKQWQHQCGENDDEDDFVPYDTTLIPFPPSRWRISYWLCPGHEANQQRSLRSNGQSASTYSITSTSNKAPLLLRGHLQFGGCWHACLHFHLVVQTAQKYDSSHIPLMWCLM